MIDLQTSEIIIPASRLASLTRYFETVKKQKKKKYINQKTNYCIIYDTVIKSPWLWTSGKYIFDVMEERWWFTYASWEVTIPRDWIYYVWFMVNRYINQIGYTEMTLDQTLQKSSVTFPVFSSIDNNSWPCTLWASNIIRLAKNEKISISYHIWNSWVPWAWASTIDDYSQNRLMIFELPTLSIS
jgi:hypothetical protein